MSWSKYLSVDLSPEEVEEVLDAIDATGIIDGKWSKQSWGWSSECDISLDNGKVCFSGIEFSRDSMLPERFRREVEERRKVFCPLQHFI